MQTGEGQLYLKRYPSENTLVSWPFLAPVFGRLQYTKLKLRKAWEQGYLYLKDRAEQLNFQLIIQGVVIIFFTILYPIDIKIRLHGVTNALPFQRFWVSFISICSALHETVINIPLSFHLGDREGCISSTTTRSLQPV